MSRQSSRTGFHHHSKNLLRCSVFFGIWLVLPASHDVGFLFLSLLFFQAPGEAEADLAELNRRNHIDAIFSEDNDNLVFGARCVIRMCAISILFIQSYNSLIQEQHQRSRRSSHHF